MNKTVFFGLQAGAHPAAVALAQRLIPRAGGAAYLPPGEPLPGLHYGVENGQVIRLTRLADGQIAEVLLGGSAEAIRAEGQTERLGQLSVSGPPTDLTLFGDMLFGAEPPCRPSKAKPPKRRLKGRV